METLIRVSRLGAAAAVLVLFASCGGDAEEGGPARHISADVQTYYQANPEFFKFATPADIPANLVWEDGSDLPELGSPNAKKGGTYNGRIQDFPRTLRPYGPDANSSFRPWILDDVVMQLARLHPDLPGAHRYYAGIAQDWAIDKANRTVYIHLDPAAKWSDGNPITTDDMLFMFYFFQSEDIQEPWYNNWYGKDVNYSNITKYDDRTFSIQLKESRPNMLSLVLELNPIPSAFYKEFGDDFVERYQWSFVPTTGAYVIADDELERIRSDRTGITLKRNPDWWAANKRNWRYRYNYDEIALRVIRDTPKAFEAALAGELDFIGGMSLAEYWYDQFPNTHELVQRGLVHKTTFYNDVPRPTYGLWMNSAMPLLDNQDIRMGIQYASNWQLVLDQYFRGDYQRMNTTSDGYGEFTHPTLQARAFDINKALEHFAKAGFTKRGPDGVLVNDAGQKLSFNLSSGYESLAPILNILRQEALKAGLELRVEVLDASAAWKKVQEKNHDIAFTAFDVGVEQYPRYWETYHSVNAFDQAFLADGHTPNPNRKPKPQTNNLMSIAVPELDSLISLYDDSEDLEIMKGLAHKMEEIIYDHGSFSPGFVQPFYRTAYWRWMQFPEKFDARFSRGPNEFFMGWIDQAKKEETLAARRGTQSFPVGINVYSQWRTD
jgi:microcin C transport system substrate-binding protein